MTIPNIFNLLESVDRFCASPPDVRLYILSPDKVMP